MVALSVPPLRLDDEQTVAQAFADGVTFSPKDCAVSKPTSPASTGDAVIGLPCRISGQNLSVEAGDRPLDVVDLFLAEISCAPFPVTARPDLMALAIVMPAAGEGIMGTLGGGTDVAGRDCWFVLVGGGQYLDVMDALSVVGCMRSDLSQAFSASPDGDGIIGEGAYATVRCMHHRSGSAVAVKLMNASVELPAIEREVATLIEMQPHPHIVGFRGMFSQFMGEDKPRMAVAFDIARCGDLLYKVLKFGAMQEGDARTLFQGVMSALAHIHSRQIVHRDIKAENILLKTQESAIVADFGLATWVSDEAQMSRRCGSPGYVAPEVCLGTPYGFKVDVFGAGIVLYFLLSKEMPFSSPDRDTAATMRRTVKCSLHLHRPPWDRMTSRLRNILRQTICKNQEERLTSQGVLEHTWLTGPAPRPPLTTEQLAQLRAQQRNSDGVGDADELGPLPSLREGALREPPAIPAASSHAAPVSPDGPPLPAGRPAAPNFRRGRSTGYPNQDRPPEVPTPSGGGTTSPAHLSPTVSPAAGAYPCLRPQSPQSPASAAGFGAHDRRSAGGPHMQERGGVQPMLPHGGDEDDPPLFPVGAGAIVAEARAAAAASLDPPTMPTRNVRRLGGLPPSAREGQGQLR